MPGDGGGRARRLRILIVEDEVLIADYLAMLLEDAGHEIAGTATNAAAALQLLKGSEVDLVTLDVRLPGGMDGIELAEILRERAGPPFLYITGSGDPSYRARCEATRPLAIVQKPVQPEALLEIVERAAEAG
jgi:two-component system, response regulator PdtaR